MALNGFIVVAVFLGRYLGTVRGAADRVIATLQERLDVAGVTVFDTRLRRLAEGAVGMVDHALSNLNERDIVDLDEERKAAMVSNLMVVPASDRGARPVVNSGSLDT